MEYNLIFLCNQTRALLVIASSKLYVYDFKYLRFDFEKKKSQKYGIQEKRTNHFLFLLGVDVIVYSTKILFLQNIL